MDRGGNEISWQMALLQLNQMNEDLEAWPLERLPKLQDAAMRLLRGMSRRIPEQYRGMPDTSPGWWEAERHHGLGDRARHAALLNAGDDSPRERHACRPRSDSGDHGPGDDDMSADSHRRRRLLAMHLHEHL